MLAAVYVHLLDNSICYRVEYTHDLRVTFTDYLHTIRTEMLRKNIWNIRAQEVISPTGDV